MASEIILKPSEIRFFHSCVARTDDTERCWEWQDELAAGGYGTFRRRWPAHRVAYFLHYDEQPRDQFVLHKCNNPPCCNPHHLYLGTQKQNMEQASREGRLHQPHRRVLTNEQAQEVIDHPEISDCQFAKRFGCLPSVIWRIRKGLSYKDIQRSTHES